MYTDIKGWYNCSDSDTVIVFIHGLLSNSKMCWTNEKCKTFWPELVKIDARLGNPSIFLAEFHTNLSSGDYKIADCSKEILRAMCIEDENTGLTVIEKNNIIFVGHSTGGIIARHIIESNQDKFLGKNIGLALYASPSLGSIWANRLSPISRVMNNQLMKELKWGNSALDDLDDRFRNLLASNKLNIKGFEAYENKPPFIGMPKIVNKQSAGLYFAAPLNIAGTTHSSIVKPCSSKDASHEAFVFFLQENKKIFNESKLFSSIEKIILSSFHMSEKDDVLFEFYTPNNDRLYLNRSIDNEIKNTIKNNHIWLCGPTGIGKTVALQKAIHETNTGFKYISLGSCINENTLYMFNEILLELSPDFEVKEYTISYCIKNIISIIKKHCQHYPLILHIEEIPILDRSMFDSFSNAIYAILRGLRETKNFRLLLSSIYTPADIKDTEFEKISEGFKILNSSHWSDVDIKNLIDLINKNLDVNESTDINESTFKGSPRQVKIFYRDLLACKKIRA